MLNIVKPLSMSVAMVALCACSGRGEGQGEMSWARAALDRNERVQVVAADPQAKTFTVKVKESGELVVLPLDQVIAGPAALFQSPRFSMQVGKLRGVR